MVSDYLFIKDKSEKPNQRYLKLPSPPPSPLLGRGKGRGAKFVRD